MDGSLQGQIVLLILSVSLWSCRYGDNLHSESYFLSQEDKVLIQEGDIILRMGEGWLSQFICKHLHDTIRVSHCGILVKSEADWKVIHVLSKEVSDTDGVQSCPLDQFTAESEKGSIRIARLKQGSAKVLAGKARYYLNRKIPFDHQFDWKDSTAFFCSELPLHILKYHMGINLYPQSGNPRFSVFLDKQHFEEVVLPLCQGGFTLDGMLE